MSTAAESKPKEDIRDELVFILSLSNETDDVVRYLWKVMLLYSLGCDCSEISAKQQSCGKLH